MFYEIMIAQKVLFAAAQQLLHVYLFSNLEASFCINSAIKKGTLLNKLTCTVSLPLIAQMSILQDDVPLLP